jgi:hypothetical protein
VGVVSAVFVCDVGVVSRLVVSVDSRGALGLGVSVDTDRDPVRSDTADVEEGPSLVGSGSVDERFGVSEIAGVGDN